MNDWSDEETDDAHYADDRNFYKVELWTKDTQRILRMLYAGSNLDKARTIFTSYIRIRPARPDHHSAADAGTRSMAASQQMTPRHVNVNPQR